MLGIGFDPADVPRDVFVVAGDAWIRCREEALDPARCGLEGEGQSGWWWIAGNLICDVAALSKMDLLPWDVWGAMPGPEDPITHALNDEFDRLAVITADPRSAADSRAHYPSERLRVPAQVYNFLRRANEPVLATA